MPDQYIENCTIGEGTDIAEFVALQGCDIGRNCQIWRFVNMYDCIINDDCMIGTLVEIQNDVQIGDRSKIQSHSFICSQVEIEADVFIGHGVKFVNDRYPPRSDPNQWEETIVRKNASIGTNATILPVEIGENALVGAGAVVVDDVPPGAVVAGNPAEVIK